MDGHHLKPEAERKTLHIRSFASVDGILQGNIIQYFMTIGQRVLRSRETPRRNADKSY